MRPVVFLDTNVLLKGFAAFRAGRDVPLALSDSDADRYTFEKCVFEAYLTFRGIGGKKPDEGRGRWAESHLTSTKDPFPLGKLTSKYHGGNTQLGHFWINNIESVACGAAEDYKNAIAGFVRPEEQDEALRILGHLEELAEQRHRYDELCRQFNDFLDAQQVKVISYQAVFGQKSLSVRGGTLAVHPACMDSLIRETAIPSEDYEIVFAALRLEPQLFVTDDERLISATWSLGLNLPLSVASFCSAADYPVRVAECRARAAGAE